MMGRRLLRIILIIDGGEYSSAWLDENHIEFKTKEFNNRKALIYQLNFQENQYKFKFLKVINVIFTF